MAPADFNQIHDQAKKLFQQQQYAKALELLDQSGLEENAHVVFARARCLFKLGRKEEARACCERLRTKYKDPRWKKLAAKLRDHAPAAVSDRPDVSRVPVRSRRRLKWGIGIAAGLVVLAGGLAGAIFRTLGGTNSAPVIAGTIAAAVEAPEPSVARPAQANTPTLSPAPSGRPSQDNGGRIKLRLRGPGGFDLDGADEEGVPQFDSPTPRSEPSDSGTLQLRAPSFSSTLVYGPPDAAPIVPPAFGTRAAAPPVAAPALPDGQVDSIMDLQPFKTKQRLTNARGDEITLTNVNPQVGAWYVLDVNVAGKKTALHLEVSSLHGNPLKKLGLSLYRDGLAVAADGSAPRLYPMWAAADAGAQEANAAASTTELNPAPVLADMLTPGHTFQSPLTVICDGFVLIRTHKGGASTKLESATDLLRETRVGEWFVAKAKPYLIPAPEIGEDHQGNGAAAHPSGETYPQDGRVDESNIALYCTPENLGIETEAPDRKLFYGRWYKAVNHPHIFVSMMKPTLVEKAILDSYSDRVGPIGRWDKKRREADALVYLVAYDVSEFAFGYALGADHPKVEWSPRVGNRKGKGPDGFSSKAPFATVGTLPPYYAPVVVSTFTGGFKREHGAFVNGPLSKVNNGSHFGFMEQGVVFSQPQPDLASIVIARDGSIDMITWPQDGSGLLAKLTHVRQNCVPVVEGFDAGGMSVPGKQVNNWGAGAWSGDQSGDCVTLRAGTAIQESGGHRFLFFAYFTGATPNAMARVFQAYGCRYGMLLDMNTLNYCYCAFYRRDAEGKIVGADYLHKAMAVGNGEKGSLKFIETNDTRDFFYVLRNPQ